MQLLTSSGTTIIPQKYIDHRSEFQNGDLVLYRGSSLLARAIQYFDSAYYNHVGVVVKSEQFDRLLTLDMWTEGLACVPLSRRMAGYKDFCILRPQVDPVIVDSAIKKIMQSWDGRDIKYDMLLLLRIAMIKKTGIDITGLSNKERYICSEFAQYYTHSLGLENYDQIDLITPQDFLRYKNDSCVTLLDNQIK